MMEKTPEDAIIQDPWIALALFVLILAAYVVFDQANGQKNIFRQRRQGTYVHRGAFPDLPWTDLGPNPRCLETQAGSPLLTDGWYRYARKMHYTADIIQSISWGLTCGFQFFMPYFYACFFVTMLLHRVWRDEIRCRKKYGADWDRYIHVVPYRFIPGIL